MGKKINDKMTLAEEIVKKQLDFYNSSDLEGFTSTYTEDVEIYDLPSCKLRFKSRNVLLKEYADTFSKKPNARILKRIVQGNKVIDHELYIREGMDKEASIVAIYEVDLEKKLISKVWFIK
ncbi:MAG: hypothetical protein ACOCUI_03510 [bacterium]